MVYIITQGKEKKVRTFLNAQAAGYVFGAIKLEPGSIAELYEVKNGKRSFIQRKIFK